MEDYPAKEIVTSLTVFAVLSATFAVVSNTLSILGFVFSGNETILLGILVHLSALSLPLIGTPLSLAILHDWASFADPTHCIIACSAQMCSVATYVCLTIYPILVFHKELAVPGFTTNNWRRLKAGAFTCLAICPIFFVILSGIFIQGKITELHNNATFGRFSELCDWTIYPMWFPYFFVYALEIPGVTIILIFSTKLLFLAKQKAANTAVQVGEILENNHHQANGLADRLNRTLRKQTRVICMVIFGLLIICGPIVIGTLVMLHCPKDSCGHPVVFNPLWAVCCNLSVTFHAVLITALSVDQRRALRRGFQKLIACTNTQYPVGA